MHFTKERKIFSHSNSFTTRNQQEVQKLEWAMGGVRAVCNHTNTTRSHIGGNHDGRLSSLELVEDPVALGLLFVAVNG
jgi:hypothetical protein